MDFVLGKPHIGESADRLAEIEKDWEKWYDGDNSEFEIHDSPWLERCIDKVTDGKTNLRWFIPLCEKSPAMKWLYDRGDEVIGVELVGKAIEKFFHTYGMSYTKSAIPQHYGCLYQSDDKRIKIFKCNIFDVTIDLIGGPVDAIWDRGSLQDIDYHERPRYGEILLSVMKPGGRILAETFEVIDQGSSQSMSGDGATQVNDQDDHHGGAGEEHPPHDSVNGTDFDRLYGDRCTIQVLADEHWGADYKPIDKNQPYFALNTIRLVNLK